MDESRLARVRENLARRTIDQMLVVDPLSIWWLCGYYTEPYERFLALYVPAEGTPTLFANRLFPDASGCGARVVEFSDTDDPVPLVAQVTMPGEYRRLGAQGHSFSPIVSFGDHAADPHHEPDDTPFVPGDMVLFDVGCKRDWYCSDMTRTFFSAEPTEHQRAVYDAVRRANEEAEKIVRPGVTFAEIDLTARRVIEDAGWGPAFTHRLGHQIGLVDHEPGDVSSTHDEPVRPGQCFSIEPGIYLPGDMGVRIEDLVIVTEDGCEVLNSYPKGIAIL